MIYTTKKENYNSVAQTIISSIRRHSVREQRDWELANLGAQSWWYCTYHSKCQGREEYHKRLPPFCSASCIIKPSIQSPSTRYLHHWDEKLALRQENICAVLVVYRSHGDLFETNGLFQAPFASTFIIIVLELSNT